MLLTELETVTVGLMFYLYKLINPFYSALVYGMQQLGSSSYRLTSSSSRQRYIWALVDVS